MPRNKWLINEVYKKVYESNDMMLSIAQESMVDIIDKGFEITISEKKSI